MKLAYRTIGVVAALLLCVSAAIAQYHYSPQQGNVGGLFAPVIVTPTTSSTGFTTALNQSATFTASNNAAGITLIETAPQTGTNSYEGIVGAYPSAPFTKTFLLSNVAPATSTASNWEYAGFIITTTTASTSPAMQMYTGIYNGGNQIAVQGTTNLTHSDTGTTIASITPLTYLPYMWLQYQDDGTNIYFRYSLDGSNWVKLYSVAKSSSYLGASGFGYLGVFLLNQATSGSSGYTLLSYH